MHVAVQAPWRRVLTVIAAASSAVWFMAVPASAGELTVRDSTGDMWRSTGAGEFVRAPRVSDLDYVRARFLHTDKRVVFKGKFVELRKPTQRRVFSMYTGMRDEGGKRRVVSMAADRTSVDSLLYTWRGRELRCNVRHSLDYRQNTIRLSFPRQCLDNPRSLQFSAGSSFGTNGGAFIIDDPHSRKSFTQRWTGRIRSN